MTGDRLIRFVTASAVLAVAVIAAIVSYSHVYDLGIAHGQSGTAARLLPLSVDGLILAASLVLLQAARNAHQAPALPRFALWLGIGATVAANLAYGLPYGPVGAVLSAWPGAAFVLAVEILLGSLQRSRETPASADETVPEAVPQPVQVARAATRRPRRALPAKASQGRGVHQPEVVFADVLAAGRVPGVRAVKREMRCGQDKATQIRGQLEGLLADRSAIVEVD
jgi:hypothetical protein